MVNEEKIWDYIDGSLDETARREVALAIIENKDTAALYNNLSAMHTALNGQTAEQPPLAFTDNVMRAVAIINPAPRIPLLPLLAALIPVVAVLAALFMLLIQNSAPLTEAYHINARFFNAIKLLIILIDSVLLAFFAEQWLGFKNRKTV